MREGLIAAAVLVATVPVLLGFCVFAVAAMLSVAGGAEGPPVSGLSWLGVWAVLTIAVLAVSIAIAARSLRAGRAQPHHKEYRDFRLIRHARHGPLLDPKRREIGALEVLSFRLRYLLSARPVPAWWPVISPQQAEDLVLCDHPVYLCVLATRPAPFQLWSRSGRWSSPLAGRVISGKQCDLSPQLAEQFDLYGSAEASALFTDEWLARWMLSNPDWSLEVRGDRLLAYRLPGPRPTGDLDVRSTTGDIEDAQLIAELAERIRGASERIAGRSDVVVPGPTVVRSGLLGAWRAGFGRRSRAAS